MLVLAGLFWGKLRFLCDLQIPVFMFSWSLATRVLRATCPWGLGNTGTIVHAAVIGYVAMSIKTTNRTEIEGARRSCGRRATKSENEIGGEVA